MSTTLGIHLDADDEWDVQDCTDYGDPFVTMAVHDATKLFVRSESIDALVTAVDKAKTMLEQAKVGVS